MRAFLEDACAGDNRRAAVAAVPSGILVSINSSGAFHHDEGLSPAAGIAVCPQGRIFVTDEFNHRVLVYAPGFSLTAAIGGHGAGIGEFRYPRGIAIAPNGTVYVADAWNHRIVVIGPDLAVKGSIGELGNGAGQLDEPCGVAFVNGALAVLEKSNHRLQLFTPEGISTAIFGKRGSADEQARFYAVPVPPELFSPPVFEFPTALAADAAGNFYVADTNNHRMVKLSPAGDYISAYTTPGLRYPVGAACDAAGNLHVTQFNREGVHVFSPGGIYLYKYLPRGLEMPVAVACAGNAVYVAAGMTARVAAFTLEARHDAGCALETPFAFHLKEALGAMAMGDWESAFNALGDAAASPAPSPDELAATLPEGDFAPFPPPKQPPRAGAAAFCRLLDEAAAARWKMLKELLIRKTAAADENIAATLQIEKTLLLGSGGIDDFMVARWRSIKSLLNLSADFKRTAAALRKISEFRRRLTLAGQEISARLASLAAGQGAVAAMGKTREAWFTDAAKEAPALNFNSAPAERTAFAVNENRLSQTAFEFRALWGIAADAHFEIASLAAAGLLDKNAVAEHIGPALGLLLDAPEESATRLNFLNGVEALLEAAGPDAVAGWLRANASGAAWEALGREDNIHPANQRPVYALLAALWANGVEGGKAADPAAWEKIAAFYHAEFTKFVGENAPLRVELLRNTMLLPLAEKSDPKQAAMTLRKISLLNYHLMFQERYIAGLMLEYLTRYALFAAKSPCLPPGTAEWTAAALDALIAEAAIAGNGENAATDAALQKLKTAGTADEKQDLKIRQAAASAANNYLSLLGAHLALARAALPPAVENAPRSTGTIYETAAGFHQLTGPTAALFDAAGNLYVAARSTVSVFGKDLRPYRALGTYGRGPGKLDTPMDIAFAPDGSLLVTQIYSPVIARFAPDGSFDREITLEKIDGRRVYRIQINGDGNIFASFFDGEGINVYTPDGKFLRGIPLKGSPFERLGGVRGFALVNGALYAGGNGILAAVDAVSGALRHFKETGLSFGEVNGIWPDGAGNLYFIDYARNMIAVTDDALSSARPLPAMKTVAVGALAAGGNGLLAVCDYRGNRLRLFNTKA
ncbi:MAG: hypothetical protein HZA03_08075 [Nitrospinae bacterium]|nr:hypothetical protein [Nitrospinota bacterium]